MKDRTARLWAEQDRHPGDRHRLFRVVADHVAAATVLYPGSYLDLAPSFVFDSVTYVDVDRRAAAFFADEDGVAEIVAAHTGDSRPRQVTFINRDYRDDLDLPAGHFDLLVSLYAGFVSEVCTDALRVGGRLLVNPSHGDAAMASIDPRYRLVGVVRSSSVDYRVSVEELDSFLRSKKAQDITPAFLHEWGRGVAYTRSPFAYLFERTS